MRVVFTGIGHDAKGVKRDRHWWETLAQSVGHIAADKVDGRTQLLVSSRTNTVKAKEAAGRGIQVIDYADYSTRCRTKNWDFDEPTRNNDDWAESYDDDDEWAADDRRILDKQRAIAAKAAVDAAIAQDTANPDFGIF